MSKELLFNGTQVNYYFICKRKLWLFSHDVRMEQESQLVALGKLMHESTYKRTRKDVLIDSKIAVDFIKKEGKLVLHDIKKSKKLEKAHIHQLLYYLYYLKKKGVKAEGKIDYPRIRETRDVALTPEKEREMQDILRDIRDILHKKTPPDIEKKPYCRKCSYFEFCWI